MILAEQDLGLIQGRVDRMLGMHAGELKQDVGDALILERPTGISLMDWFVVFSALSLAAMYGLLGIGISLTWASVGMLNLAHGFTFASRRLRGVPGLASTWSRRRPRASTRSSSASPAS